jgi:hypothetical protein
MNTAPNKDDKTQPQFDDVLKRMLEKPPAPKVKPKPEQEAK